MTYRILVTMESVTDDPELRYARAIGSQIEGPDGPFQIASDAEHRLWHYFHEAAKGAEVALYRYQQKRGE